MQFKAKKKRYIIMCVVFLLLLTAYYRSYRQTRQLIKNKYHDQQSLVEENILNTLNYIELTYEVIDENLAEEMEEYLLLLENKYRENPNVLDWDLSALQEKMENYELYIIDEELRVIATTFSPDLNLDFKEYSAFAELLKERLAADSFASDRMNLSINTGELKKYSYLPTPDNRYLLQLGITVAEEYPVGEINLTTTAKQLKANYDLVKDISFYKYINQDKELVGEVNYEEPPYIDVEIAEEKQDVVEEAFIQEETIAINANSRADRYIPYLVQKNSQLDWWNSYVAGISYDNSLKHLALRNERRTFWSNILFVSLIFIIFSLLMDKLLRKTEYLAYHDSLTKLPNRKLFTKKFAELVKRNQDRDSKIAILFLDLDDFKEVNDNYGHDIGDVVLCKMASRLKSVLRKEDFVARIGGDEFVILLDGIKSRTDIKKITRRVNHLFAEKILIADSEISITASIGISIYPDDAEELEQLLKMADSAMYEAKEDDGYFVYFEFGR
ncbi:GGDEF domain-containing protein [Fuchsiella alkaliacetigena]|uniref:GGDEF domain-containing protein n=1 Tax=Fuchsiella alkaliacetigena TaxID=957042 RepID=UPI002009EECE|nr:GGDEF domain-containing protein [Fuchsiella alkaliacetigena]MCK8823448.1 GGDEF domain-containing protein [Fuchsiella alkaliacetigena]